MGKRFGDDSYVLAMEGEQAGFLQQKFLQNDKIDIICNMNQYVKKFITLERFGVEKEVKKKEKARKQATKKEVKEHHSRGGENTVQEKE